MTTETNTSGTEWSTIGMRSRSLFVGNVRTSRVMTLPRSTVMSAVAPGYGAGTRISAVSPTS